MTISFSTYPWLYVALAFAVESENFGRDSRPDSIEVPDVYRNEIARAETALAGESLAVIGDVATGFLSPLSRSLNADAKRLAERNPALVDAGDLIVKILTVLGLYEPDDDGIES